MSPASGAGRRVTIRSMSCRGVKAFVPFQKPPLYAAVSLGGRREKTPPDPDGGENPDWDGAAVAFDLDGDGPEQQLVQFEVKAQVPLLGTKLVGTASVPVADLAPGDGAALRHVSYQVCAPDGKPNGTLSFAYAISSGVAGPRPPQLQLHTAADGGAPPPEQGPSFCSAPPPPPPITAYPAPSTANFAPPPSPPGGSGSSLYPPLHDLLTTSSTYPPPPSTLTSPHFPEPNSGTYPPPDSVYPPPAPNSSVYPPPPDSCCTPYPAPPGHYSSSYPPQPATPSSYPPPPPSGYPPSPASNLAPPTTGGTYPPPPPESGSVYPSLPRSVDRELRYYPSAPVGSYYPRPPELDGGAARAPYYYPPPPGPRYP